MTSAQFTMEPDRERVVVVAPGPSGRELVADVRGQVPDWRMVPCESYLSAIAEVAKEPTRAVIATIDGYEPRLEDAVAGLREVAGPRCKLILCCPPQDELAARRILEHGADDYLVLPLEARELEAALGIASLTAFERPQSDPSASLAELKNIASVLSKMNERPSVLLEALADLVCRTFDARGAVVVVEGSIGTAGDPVERPLLSAPLRGRDGLIGQLLLSERRDGAYSLQDTEKLKHYAEVAGHILQTAATQRHWRRLAMVDECSGLPNRRALFEQLDSIIERATSERFPVTLLLFDVDDFKTYNDAYGHDAGDAILRTTGELFRRHCREQDIVTRYGGDEFVVVFWDAEGSRQAGSKHPDSALAVLDRFREALRSQHFPKMGSAGEGRLTISGGLATYPWDGATRDELLRSADDRLLAAKRAGKNRIFLIGG